MKRNAILLSTALLFGITASVPLSTHVAVAHDAKSFSAGQPGDPKRSARVVAVTMKEGDGKMSYAPDRIAIRKGEQIRFVLKNDGELDHEFLLATTEENLKHAEVMKKFPDMEHDEPNGKRLASKGKNEILWRFTKAGEFEFSCLIPGHREAGMLGKIIVK